MGYKRFFDGNSMKKKIVGIDYGLKRIGLAISNENHTFALPWTTILGGEKDLITALQSRKEQIQAIVIGLPLLLNGTKGEMALKVEAFGKSLQKQLSIEIFFIDERLSSKQADLALRDSHKTRKSRTLVADQTAATIILQTFLDLQLSQKAFH